MSISNKKVYTITEYNSFTRDTEVSGYQPLPKSIFDTLENYLLSENIKTER